MDEIRVFDENKITTYQYRMYYEDIPFLKEIYDPRYMLTTPVIEAQVEPVLNCKGDPVEIIYFFGFSPREGRLEIDREWHYGDRTHIKAYVDRYVRSHFLQHPESFDWQMKKLAHEIMMSDLPRYDPEITSDNDWGFVTDFSEKYGAFDMDLDDDEYDDYAAGL